jgi:uncharacterized protein
MTTSRCSDPPPEGLRQGIEMYNQGLYYECHEVLEDTWREESDDVRYLYQGILQIGVAFHHLSNDNWRGAVGLLSGGVEKVSRYLPECMDVNTEKLVREAQACLDMLNELGKENVRQFDWSMVPRIDLDDR